ncbi:MAG: tRNA (adenosine(37)-N6)-threonylcarbamoyltransferase complex dimerization subunit type 1 TsaB [Pseudomonadota bacterium]|nr:tRNA (adenosine(37)-N6)-threonylcarbamoyltransferase complex dimerization subunit type 1 TsaB [Pseudomonadota bacterium]
MKAILIDSSASACSVCVTTDKVVTGHNYVSMDRGHASAIVPMIKSTMKDAKTHFEELRFVAVTKGPGSFTGLRVSLAAAKAIALSNNIPLFGVSCFDAIASRVQNNRNLPPTDILLIVIESKREELYVECRDKRGTKIIESQALSIPEIVGRFGGLYQPGESVRISGDAGALLVEAVGEIIKPNGPAFIEDLLGVDALDITTTKEYWDLFKSAANLGYTYQVDLNYLRKPDVSIPKK